MSTSPSLAPASAAPGETLEEKRSSPELRPFPYDSIPAGARRPAIEAFSASRAGGGEDARVAAAAAREAQARAEGQREGQAETRKSFEEQLARERTNLANAVAGFHGDRAAYFQKVEGEVVQLALSIARKILHREAQIDPLLLAGIVRVALEKIDGATEISLRVHPQHAAEWRTFLIGHMAAGVAPVIVEDASQPPDCCVLQTSMGTAVVGVEVQLKEIEQGLMDLLAARPGAAS